MLFWFSCSEMAFLVRYAFSTNSSLVHWGAHWNGVKGFGTKKEVLVTICTLPLTRFSFGTVSKKVAAILLESSAIPRISSSVSVGCPSMKYSLTLVQPPSKARAEPCKITSSVSPLLMTSRSLWLPASGAKVRLDFFTSCTLLMTSREKASIRKDGREILICLLSHSSIRKSISSGSLL